MFSETYRLFQKLKCIKILIVRPITEYDGYCWPIRHLLLSKHGATGSGEEEGERVGRWLGGICIMYIKIFVLFTFFNRYFFHMSQSKKRSNKYIIHHKKLSLFAL